MRAIDFVRKLPAVEPAAPLAEAARKLLAEGVEAVAVVSGDEVVGVLSEDDLVSAVARGLPPHRAVAEVLERPPLVVEGHEPLWKVAEAMLAVGAEVAAVSIGGRYAGAVLAGDIAAVEAQLSEAAAFAELADSQAPPAD